MVYLENIRVMGCTCLVIVLKGKVSFYLCGLLADCLQCTPHSGSIMKLFPFSSTFVERFSGLVGDFVFSYISPKVHGSR